MLPAQRGQELQHAGVGQLTRLALGLRRPLQVDCFPRHDGRRHKVQANGTVSLPLEEPVAGLASR